MTQHKPEMARRDNCGERYGQHPSLPHLVAVCTLPHGHSGEHSNVLPKTL